MLLYIYTIIYIYNSIYIYKILYIYICVCTNTQNEGPLAGPFYSRSGSGARRETWSA